MIEGERRAVRWSSDIKQTIGKEREVSGVIVAKSISENLRCACSIVPNVFLYE